MRPVNLLPEGSAARSRGSGGLPAIENKVGFLIIGGLVAVLIGVIAMVHFSNQVGEKQDEIAQLEATEAETQARAASLTQFTSFQTVREARQETITQLAESRFDWERVMQELSIVLPKRVWLTNLTGTVSPEVAVEKAAATTLRAAVPGPALALVGCARSQRDVARLIAAVEDLDGVTRVTVEDSAKPDGAIAGGGAEQAEVNTSEDCRTRDFVPQFHLVAAFDPVAVPEGIDPATAVTAPAATTAPAETTPSTPTTTTASTDAGEPATTSEQDEVAEAEDESGEALDILSGKGKQR
jgi:Tfp pilus assembly protein PilN